MCCGPSGPTVPRQTYDPPEWARPAGPSSLLVIAGIIAGAVTLRVVAALAGWWRL